MMDIFKLKSPQKYPNAPPIRLSFPVNLRMELRAFLVYYCSKRFK